MRKETLLFLVGILVFVTPLAGIPLAWKEIGLFGAGALIMFIALLSRIEVRRRERRALDASYVENQPRFSEEQDPLFAVEDEQYAREN